ncbi:MAG TPA: MBL fold metallo-hydrolase [Methanoregula sp.]|nr:MBL fold metallo-hydrolase [Methanoregula sp.]
MEIVPNIHQVDGVNGNCYIVARDRLTIIDTGLPGSGGKILAYIRNTLHRDPSQIGTLAFTHFHMDHTGGAAVLKKGAPGAKIAAHEAEADYMSGKIAPPRHPGAKGFLLHIAGAVMRPEHISPEILLKDGDRIDGLLCVHTPGHTPGSIGLLDEETRTFFSGDTLRFDGTSIGRGPAGFTMDLAAETASIRKIAGLSFDTLLVGHGVPLQPEASVKVREFAEKL